MTDPLRPSKSGAGHTYGGSDPATRPGPAPPVALRQQAYDPPPAYGPASPYGAPPYPVSPTNCQMPAIVAAVLALLGGALRAYYSFGLVQGLYYLSKISGDLGSYFDHSVFVGLMVYSVASLAATASLLLGGIMLLGRKRAGRSLIVLGCTLLIVEAVVTWVAAATFMQSLGVLGSGRMDGALNLGASTVVMAALSIGFPLLTTILALAPATRRWCR